MSSKNRVHWQANLFFTPQKSKTVNSKEVTLFLWKQLFFISVSNFTRYVHFRFVKHFHRIIFFYKNSIQMHQVLSTYSYVQYSISNVYCIMNYVLFYIKINLKSAIFAMVNQHKWEIRWYCWRGNTIMLKKQTFFLVLFLSLILYK